MRHARHRPQRRSAFTLIELLVVMALILGVTALGIGYVVFSTPHEAAVKGAGFVYGAMVNAKGRARRDSLPTGVRILFGTNGQATQLQFIQQPEDYNQGVCQGNAPPPTSPPPPPDMHLYTVLFNTSGTNSQGFATGVDFQGGANFIGEIDESTVQAGDYFTLTSPLTPHRISKVYYSADSSGNLTVPTLDLNSPVAVQAGSSYRIIRAPRRLPSEDVITLPPNLVIDNRSVSGAGLCQNLPFRTLVDYPPGPIAGDPTPYDGTIPRRAPPSYAAGTAPTVAEILFAPAGGVVGQGTGADKVYLWLANPALAAGDGSSLILAVQIRTGIIGTYPVAPGADPYAYAKDPRASGL